MVTPDPLDNEFYTLTPFALNQWHSLDDRGKARFDATMRPLAMGTSISSPFVQPADPPIDGADRFAQMPKVNFRIHFRPPTNDTPITVTHIAPVPNDPSEPR